MTEPPWSVPIRLDEIQATGRHIELEASAEVRAALAKPAGVEAIERLSASFDLSWRGRDGIHVAGEVRATVHQACVVTLEPLINRISEPFALDFAPVRDEKLKEDSEIEIDVDAADEPEPLSGNSIDLGLIATEFLILGIDPFPRKPDAAFTGPAPDDAAGHPFAALAALKKDPTVKE